MFVPSALGLKRYSRRFGLIYWTPIPILVTVTVNLVLQALVDHLRVICFGSRNISSAEKISSFMVVIEITIHGSACSYSAMIVFSTSQISYFVTNWHLLILTEF